MLCPRRSLLWKKKSSIVIRISMRLKVDQGCRLRPSSCAIWQLSQWPSGDFCRPMLLITSPEFPSITRTILFPLWSYRANQIGA